jgi:hypothetical protein
MGWSGKKKLQTDVYESIIFTKREVFSNGGKKSKSVEATRRRSVGHVQLPQLSKGGNHD